jgi:hypothetical protein
MSISTRNKISRNIQNVRGWRTKKRILVIESDDWGTVRMATKKAYQFFLNKGLPVDKCAYSSNDTLESNDDLALLFDVLASVKDSKGNTAVMTANNIVANPDFEKIKANHFQQYFYEPFTATLNRYPNHNNVESLYREGIDKNIFRPQFHGREHVNISRWMKALQNKDENARLAFDQAVFSVHTEKPTELNEYMDAFDADNAKELHSHAQIVQEGLAIFQQLWGYQSKSFIAPCYIWSSSLEPVLANSGVRYLQGLLNQLEPILQPGYQYKKRFHFQGSKNASGQRYLIRNAFFEPSTNPGFDWVNDCLHRIEIAFRWNKPAIISAHRLNFCGEINPDNRGNNLKLFAQLLNKIKQRWPAVEFMSSDMLGDVMTKNEQTAIVAD